MLSGRFLDTTITVILATLGRSLAFARGFLGRTSRRSVGDICVRVRRAATTTAILKVRGDIINQLTLRVAIEDASGCGSLVTS